MNAPTHLSFNLISLRFLLASAEYPPCFQFARLERASSPWIKPRFGGGVIDGGNAGSWLGP